MDEINKIDCPLECGARIIYFTKHLKKCRNKNLLGTEFKICPYNSLHIIKANIYTIPAIANTPNNIAKGSHSGLNIHHQLQSILSNILAKKNAKNIIVAIGNE